MRQGRGSPKGRWTPNLEGGLLSFAIEVLVVLILALIAVGVAAVALLVL